MTAGIIYVLWRRTEMTQLKDLSDSRQATDGIFS